MIATQISTKPQADFIKVLLANGFRKGARDWHEYERGKRIITRLSTSTREYERMISILTNFLGV